MRSGFWVLRRCERTSTMRNTGVLDCRIRRLKNSIMTSFRERLREDHEGEFSLVGDCRHPVAAEAFSGAGDD